MDGMHEMGLQPGQAEGGVGQNDFFDELFARNHENVNGRSHELHGAASTTPNSSYSHQHHHTQHIPPLPPMSQLPMEGGAFDLGSIMNQMQPPAQGSGGNYNNPQFMLEQRLKLNQLQQLQLQSQIIQQQIEMMNGQSSGGPIDVDQRQKQQSSAGMFMGLPTPLNSTEIHAQPSSDFVSPMTLSYLDSVPLPPSELPLHPHHLHSAGVHSAPANIVFNTAPPVPLPSPGDLNDVDLSPLTSPWIEAYNKHEGSSSHGSGGRSKRTASPNDEDAARYGRPRPSPALVPTQPGPARSTRRGTKSASSTPLMRSTRPGGRKAGTPASGALDMVVGDSPSPVDLSMPPPAPPGPVEFSVQHTQHDGGMQSLGHSSLSMTPVTPASMMNLGRLNGASGLAPPPHVQSGPSSSSASPSGVAPKDQQPSASKPTRRRSATTAGPSKRSGGTPLVSPALKPILPAGGMSNAGGALAQTANGPPGVKKTSHKAAEQKRRDSLKTTFDELRGLLPPIPLPTEDGYDEPLLPGAMPPRGPPRGNVDGPNRGISKLQLLRCGNEYIRMLKGQITRRDDEMDKLRREIRRLRLNGPGAGEELWEEGEEACDLERDVDEGIDLGPWKRSNRPEDEEGDDE
ncbi:unnamed protein product [Peniophora sp. CBMAI 1063]|nr:unnamed protein product [Peniophora sp. CBMAI 1063]